MVFVDARGDKIAGTVKRELVGQFNRVLQEGDTKVIINFSVTNSGGSYRPSKHPFKIVFLPTTRVRICEDLPNNLTGLNPVNFGDVLNGVLDDDYLVDVIGQIVEVTQLEIVSVNGKDTQKISVELRNEDDERLPLVSWGKFAEDVSNAIQLRSEQSIVCVLRFGKIKVWKEDRSISNAYNVSNVSLNPHATRKQGDSDGRNRRKFVGIDRFRRISTNPLPRDDLALAIVDSKSNAVVPTVKERDDFFRHTPRKTISQVLESKQVEKCIVMASIGAIDSDMGWYYLSCKVSAKKVLTVPNDIEDGDEFNVSGHNYYCVKCKDKNPQLLPRYKLHLVVLDSTNDTKFLLFDNLAMQLLHEPCLELTGPVTDEIQDPDMLPPILQDLVGKTLLFKIGIERENYLYKHPTYKVLKIMSNINEFDAIGSPTVCVSMDSVGSLMLHGGSSQSDKTGDLTPAKRMRSPIINLEDAFDQNSVTRSAGTIKIKQEKNEKSG
ncbi:hypothetical protein Bca52824_046515 [Brassica carinata]|uniref:Uncharacterized protein n=1 Tax=Brassica carinata TaxID=52824 RepID=A0A8X7USI1_BRACI|nr:hypothetical protein Bca52824_046515 [Brassica carinata]